MGHTYYCTCLGTQPFGMHASGHGGPWSTGGPPDPGAGLPVPGQEVHQLDWVVVMDPSEHELQICRLGNVGAERVKLLGVGVNLIMVDPSGYELRICHLGGVGAERVKLLGVGVNLVTSW